MSAVFYIAEHIGDRLNRSRDQAVQQEKNFSGEIGAFFTEIFF